MYCYWKGIYRLTVEEKRKKEKKMVGEIEQKKINEKASGEFIWSCGNGRWSINITILFLNQKVSEE